MEDFLDALKCQIRSIILLEHSIKIIFKSDDKKKPSIQFIETQFFSLMVIYSKLHKIPVMLDLKVIAGSSVSDTEEYPVSQEIATKMSTKTLLWIMRVVGFFLYLESLTQSYSLDSWSAPMLTQREISQSWCLDPYVGVRDTMTLSESFLIEMSGPYFVVWMRQMDAPWAC